jgi:hypothetical protein
MGPGVLITGLRGFVDNLLGRGEAAIAVPSFDGALKPNQRLEEAAVVLENVGAEDLATDGVNLYLASGKQLLRLSDDAALPIRSFDKTITALTFLPGARSESTEISRPPNPTRSSRTSARGR